MNYKLTNNLLIITYLILVIFLIEDDNHVIYNLINSSLIKELK